MPRALSPEDSSPGSLVNWQSDDLTPAQLERMWNAEHRDESWAPAAEIGVGGFLARQPQPNALGLPSIECRATLCRVRTSVDAAIYQAVPTADLQAAMYTLQHDSIAGELVWLGLEMSSDPEQLDQVIQSAYLRRIEHPAEAKP